MSEAMDMDKKLDLLLFNQTILFDLITQTPGVATDDKDIIHFHGVLLKTGAISINEFRDDLRSQLGEKAYTKHRNKIESIIDGV